MQCPICKKSATSMDDAEHPNPYFPFCSDRCKLIDLGRWLDGKYWVPVHDEESIDESTKGTSKRK